MLIVCAIVVYTSLRATVTCGSSMLDTTGPSFEAKTIGYSSRFLAFGTLEIPGPNCNEYVVAGGFHTIDFLDLYTNPITTSTLYKPGCPPYANPRLSLPADLTTVDPAWASCEPLFYGAFDPPRFLKKASGALVPSAASLPTAMAAKGAAVSDTPAVAQATPAPVTPAPTATPNSLPSDPSPKAAPPAQNAGPLSPIQPSQALAPAPTAIANGLPSDPSPKASPPAQNAGPPNIIQPSQALAPAPIAIANSLPSDPSPKAALPAQNAGPPTPIQPSQALPAMPNTPANAAQAAPANSRQSTSGFVDPANLFPDQLSQLHQALQSTTTAEPGQPQVNSGIAAGGSGEHNTPAVPVSAPGSSFSSTQQAPQEPGVALKAVPGSQSIPPSVSGQAANAVYPVAPQTQNDPVPVLVKSGDGTAKESNAHSLSNVGNAGPVQANAQSMAKSQNNPGPVLVDPGNGALVEANPNSPLVPAGAASHPSSSGKGIQNPAIPNVVNLGNGAATEGSSSNGATIPADVVYAAPGPEVSQPAAAPHPSKVNGHPVDVAPPDGGVRADLSGPTKMGTADVIGDSNTVAGAPGAKQTPTPFVMGGQTIQKAADGALLVAGQMITPGSQATVSGAVVSVGSSNVIVDGTTHAYPLTPPKTATPVIVGGNTAHIFSDGGLVVAGQTITPGSQATISHAVVSVGSSNVVIDGTTHVFPTMPSETATPLVVAGNTVQTLPAGGLVIASQTITPGSQATISGVEVSVGAGNLVVDGITHALLSTAPESPTPLVIAGQTAQKAQDGAFIFGSLTITQGSQATISGHVISVGASELVVDASTRSMSPNTVGFDASETPVPLSIAGYAVQKASNGGFVIASQTISQGSQATISGHVISVGASELVVDASTHLVTPQTLGFDSSETPIPLSIAGYAVQKGSDGGLVIASQTIARGSQATISGMVLSAGNDEVVVDGTAHSFLPQLTGTATPNSVQSIMYTTENIAMTLRSGATFQSGGMVMTYTGSSMSVLTEPTKAIIGTTTIPYRASGTVSTTLEPIVGGLIASAFGSGAAASTAPSKGSSDPASKQSGMVRSGSARGAGAGEESGTLLMTGIFALLGYILGTGFLG